MFSLNTFNHLSKTKDDIDALGVFTIDDIKSGRYSFIIEHEPILEYIKKYE